MKRILIAVILTIVLVFSTIGFAGAVTDGTPDGEGHPFVGLMVAKDPGGSPLWRCSGTLISSTVFLTAGHCTESPAATATIWFESDIQSQQTALGYPNGGSTSVDGTVFTHPEFTSAQFYMHDVGVVVLDEPVVMSTYGALPAVNSLDQYKTKRGNNKVTFTAVGYGLQKSFPDAASWKDQSQKIRMVAYPKLIQINVPGYGGDYSLLLSNNANTGGTCFGDSGGPNFLGDTNIVAGVTSFGKNGNCAGTGGVFRMDRQNVLDFVTSFME
jgi:hypothetical protein